MSARRQQAIDPRAQLGVGSAGSDSPAPLQPAPTVLRQELETGRDRAGEVNRLILEAKWLSERLRARADSSP
jgi:hypothetical protein